MKNWSRMQSVEYALKYERNREHGCSLQIEERGPEKTICVIERVHQSSQGPDYEYLFSVDKETADYLIKRFSCVKDNR